MRKGSGVTTRLATTKVCVAGFLQATISLDTGFPCARVAPCGRDCCKVPPPPSSVAAAVGGSAVGGRRSSVWFLLLPQAQAA